MIRNIVFDIGMVLIDFDWSGFLRKSGCPEQGIAVIGERAVKNPLWRTMDQGLYPEEEITRMLMESVGPQYGNWIPRMLSHYGEMCRPFAYTGPWLRRLKEAGFGLYVLSNFSSFGFERSRANFPFLELTDGLLLSCDVRLLKPDPAIFAALCGKYGLVPGECLFFDDLPENAQGAAKFGLHGQTFVYPRRPEDWDAALLEPVRECLRRAGQPVPEALQTPLTPDPGRV